MEEEYSSRQLVFAVRSHIIIDGKVTAKLKLFQYHNKDAAERYWESEREAGFESWFGMWEIY